ncbi:MAG: ABC transporter permease [Thermoleophilia bacterium]
MRFFKNILLIVEQDLISFSRDKLVIITTLLTPSVMILSFGYGTAASNFMVMDLPYIQFIAPGILALGTMFSASYSVGFSIILDRQRRLVDDLLVSPISFASFIFGRLLGGLARTIVQAAVVLSLAVIIFAVPVRSPLWTILGLIDISLIFGSIGMGLGALCSFLSFSEFVNIILLPSMYFGGVFFPASQFEGVIAKVAYLLPFTHSLNIVRYGMLGAEPLGNDSVIISSLYVIGAITGASFVVKYAFSRR